MFVSRVRFNLYRNSSDVILTFDFSQKREIPKVWDQLKSYFPILLKFRWSVLRRFFYLKIRFYLFCVGNLFWPEREASKRAQDQPTSLEPFFGI